MTSILFVALNADSFVRTDAVPLRMGAASVYLSDGRKR